MQFPRLDFEGAKMNKHLTQTRLQMILVICSFCIAVLSYIRAFGHFLPLTAMSFTHFVLCYVLFGIGDWHYSLRGAVTYILFTFTFLIITALPLTIKSPGKDTKKLTAALAYCSFLLAVPAALAVSATFSDFVSKSILSWTPVALSVALLLLFPLFHYVPNTKIKAALIIFVKIFTLLTFILYTVTLLFGPLQPTSEMP